ncbi:hypothetical protein HAX54_011773, partial [Datura stramonium]|nr:hypothetical protein [Datura stramonium]
MAEIKDVLARLHRIPTDVAEFKNIWVVGLTHLLEVQKIAENCPEPIIDDDPLVYRTAHSSWSLHQ